MQSRQHLNTLNTVIKMGALQSHVLFIRVIKAKLTCICHSKATCGVDHVHLWYQSGDILVMGECKMKNLIFMGALWEQSPC